ARRRTSRWPRNPVPPNTLTVVTALARRAGRPSQHRGTRDGGLRFPGNIDSAVLHAKDRCQSDFRGRHKGRVYLLCERYWRVSGRPTSARSVAAVSSKKSATGLLSLRPSPRKHVASIASATRLE